MGGWTEYDGIGPVPLNVVNGIVSKPSPPSGVYMCPLEVRFAQANGSVNRSLAPGPYTIYWGTFCTNANEIVVTQTIEVVSS